MGNQHPYGAGAQYKGRSVLASPQRRRTAEASFMPLKTWCDSFTDANVHMLIAAQDYAQSDRPLKCTADAGNMCELARVCGTKNLEVLLNGQCTKEGITRAIKDLGGRCGPDDYLVFYFSGRGARLRSVVGSAARDTAFCLATPEGQVTRESCMTDRFVAEQVARSVCPGAKVLIITDCCNSGAIMDLTRDEWDGRQAVAIAGCLDAEALGPLDDLAQAPTRGGLFTHALLLAIDKLRSIPDYSVGRLCDVAQRENHRVFNCAQDITIQHSRGTSPNGMAWPLVPVEAYKSPLARAAAVAMAMTPASPVRQGARTGSTAMRQLLLKDPEALPRLGVQPETLQFVAKGPLHRPEGACAAQ